MPSDSVEEQIAKIIAECCQQARDAALEEAARVAEALGKSSPSMPLYDLACETLANRIRALRRPT